MSKAAYINLIAQSAKEAEKENLDFHNSDAELLVASSILATRKELSKAKRELTKTT